MSAHATLQLRRAEPTDHDALLALWEQSVRATHDFLAEDDIAFYRGFVPRALGLLDVCMAEDAHGIAGFIGVRQTQILMLFVAPTRLRQGIGRRLLHRVIAAHPKARWSVDVNEQNPRACRFYQSYGFVQVKRTELDLSGRPFPLLFLELTPRAIASR
ncbi:MAG: GNAT family N-acetyltransferase [Dyella sp.]